MRATYCPLALPLNEYVPSQATVGPLTGETATLAWKRLYIPVPPENVHAPITVARSSLQWPNATLFPGLGGSSLTSVSSTAPTASFA